MIRAAWRRWQGRFQAARPREKFQPRLETLETRALPSFANPVSYTIGSKISGANSSVSSDAVAPKDVNGDGKLDLVVVHEADRTVNILLNKGNGSFRSGGSYQLREPVGSPWLQIGDFNGDRRPDIMVPVGGTGSNNLTFHAAVLLNRGDGTFRSPISSPTFGSSRGFAVGDFNGDRKQDLVATNPLSGTVSILLGNGNGTFRSRIVSPTFCQYSRWVTTGDFNRDGKTDLAIADGQGSNSNTSTAELTILLGRGHGTFVRPVEYKPFVFPGWVAVGDFNSDGWIDLAVTRVQDGHSVSIMFNRRDRRA
jgi:hypothetical protein